MRASFEVRGGKEIQQDSSPRTVNHTIIASAADASGTLAGITPALGRSSPEMATESMGFSQGDLVHIDEWPGQEYVIKRVLHGGMGTVYICEEKERPELKIVLKTPRQELLADIEGQRRFLREAEAWINLGDHRNIVKAHFLTRIAGQPYLVLEYVEGQNLRDKILDSTLDFKQTVDYSLQICDGMAYAHTKKLGRGRIGLLHRDLKPENVLIRSLDNRVKITDFGLAKAIEESNPSSELWGALPYMSPEQFRRKHLDERSDVYSFGVLFYEMLTSRLPFVELNFLGDLPIPTIRKYSPKVPESAEAVCQKCLQFDRERRFGSFEEVRASLRTVPATDVPPPPTPFPPRNYILVGHKPLRKYVLAAERKLDEFPEVVIRGRGSLIDQAHRAANAVRASRRSLEFREGKDMIDGREVPFVEIHVRQDSGPRPTRGHKKHKRQWTAIVMRRLKRLVG